MPLSNGTVVGLCYGFCIGAAQLYVLFSTKGAVRYLRPERNEFFETMGRALLYAVPVAAGIAALDWLGKRIDPNNAHGPPATIVTFLILGWAFSVLCLAVGSAAKRISKETGVNVLSEAKFRVLAIGVPVGLVCCCIFIFGPHLMRG